MQEFALAQSSVALVGDSTLDFDELETSLGFGIGIILGNVARFAPGVEVLQKDGFRRKVDALGLVSNVKFVTYRSAIHETPDWGAQQTSTLQQSSDTTIAPRRGWRRLRAGLFDRYQSWKANSA